MGARLSGNPDAAADCRSAHQRIHPERAGRAARRRRGIAAQALEGPRTPAARRAPACRAQINPGPTQGILVANWMAATLAGKSFTSERWFVEASGRVTMTPL